MYCGNPLKAGVGRVDDSSMATLDTISTRQLAPSLGSLLHELRTDSGETAKTVSRRCSLGVVEIAQLESDERTWTQATGPAVEPTGPPSPLPQGRRRTGHLAPARFGARGREAVVETPPT